VERRMALDLLKERGGHLNHRAVSLLRVIAANGGGASVSASRSVRDVGRRGAVIEKQPIAV
jgi:hypothetical protein